MDLIGFPEELLGQASQQCLAQERAVCWYFAARRQLRGAQGEHWAGPHLGPPSRGLGFLAFCSVS